jgi:hypothetical protein
MCARDSEYPEIFEMRSEVQPHLLLMTATVQPPANVIASHRNNPVDRMNDYADALSFYLSDHVCLIDRIVFIDNSESDLTPLQAIAQKHRGRKEVEFISFYGLDYPAEYTKGYGELKLIDFGFEHSRLLKSLKRDDKWWKVTGRYRATNLDGLIRTAPQSYDLYADFRWRKRRVDVRLLSFSRGGYERLMLGHYHETAGVQLEDYFFARFAPLISGADPEANGIFPEFYYVPRIEGIGGFRNINYMNTKYRMIYGARLMIQFAKNLVTPRRWKFAGGSQKCSHTAVATSSSGSNDAGASAESLEE